MPAMPTDKSCNCSLLVLRGHQNVSPRQTYTVVLGSRNQLVYIYVQLYQRNKLCQHNKDNLNDTKLMYRKLCN